MMSVRAAYLILAVVAASIIAEVSYLLWTSGYQPFETARVVGFAAFVVNAAVAAIGLWTPHRAAWAAYLIASLLCMMFIGAATPISALFLGVRLLIA
jgi:hypothetical protein